ncbi:MULTISPECIES: hypothetical protein [Paenibacillus]|uniref:Uncharacterized protein n=1 Tax=Paenibacillus polymyxa (strain SC2) TaxID=886882 RepID=E3E6N2_PAEPS|nr:MULTISPECIES: hypothetical protein [Paenibacillus]ADO58292.1 hypothetical protein PPSC2_20290 [Paenibacillus polymyxa SC2]AJE52606.1 hypothetical protein RE92_16905 [Paenibacillus polymyxa]QOH63565.1 hypothetical protein DI243_20125 [Paenibacillus polymyxa]WPQ55961.1 hypothetical protein SKN87_20650 [Paenibacillus polymyxa]CCI70874.1 hypothetical protein PPM_4065 [Paenibacillus polymyxa M1]
MTTTSLAHVVLGAVSAEEAGTGSGLFTTFMYLANSLGVALIGILFLSSLNHTLSDANLSDYIRAFIISVAVSGLLALAALICISFCYKNEI